MIAELSNFAPTAENITVNHKSHREIKNETLHFTHKGAIVFVQNNAPN